MSWNKIEEYLFEKYCVEGEDKELCRLMKEHDKEIRNKVIEEFIHRVGKECGFYINNPILNRGMLLRIAEQMKEVGE